AGLEHDQRELGVQLAVDHLLRGPDDEIDLLARQLAQLTVGQGGALLEDAERADHGPAPAVALHADGKVEDGALRLGAPQAVGRDFDGAQGVLLNTEGAGRAIVGGHTFRPQQPRASDRFYADSDSGGAGGPSLPSSPSF